MDPLALLRALPIAKQTPWELAVSAVVALGFVFVAGAVAVDFKNYYRQDREVALGARSLVETGTMTAFFVAYYLVIKARLLETAPTGGLRAAEIVAGLVLIVVGVVFNVWGRVLLGSYWANQIKIYADQRLLTTGPFRVVRHPLYASLIWIFIGGALVYANPLSLVMTLGIFVPMMYVRAKKEDALLAEHFAGEYEAYRKRTWMFVPKL